MAKQSVLMRPQGIRPEKRAPTCSPFATPLWCTNMEIKDMTVNFI